MSKIRDYIKEADLRYLARADIQRLMWQERSGVELAVLEQRARMWNDDIRLEAEANSAAYAATQGGDYQ